MTVLDKYLYNDFGYKVETGRVPFLVNNNVVYTDNSVPRVLWNFDFGKISMELKNAIEEAIFLDPNDTYFKSFIGPAFKIGKTEDILTGDVNYFMTYLFEFTYYNTFVNKPIPYTVDGSDHVLEGGIRIPIAQEATDVPIVVNRAAIRRRIQFLESDLGIVHKFNNVYSFKVKFYEQAAPIADSSVYTVGVSDVNYLTGC